MHQANRYKRFFGTWSNLYMYRLYRMPSASVINVLTVMEIIRCVHLMTLHVPTVQSSAYWPDNLWFRALLPQSLLLP